MTDGYYDDDDYKFDLLEKIDVEQTNEYTVVGFIERDVHESYVDAGYNCYTQGEGDLYNVYIEYKNIRKTFDYTRTIAINLGYQEDNGSFAEVDYNTDLLAVNGVIKYQNVLGALVNIIIIVLALVSIACIIVIYNSFAISVMERKKQFGLFASIGTTKKQLKHTVFYEAFIVGLIGIPLGILSAYVGIGTVIYVVNNLLSDLLSGMHVNLVTYPIFIVIPIIFMVITILISALIPAKLAARVSPIEAIRQNDDIKIKSKKVKSPKIISKIFGVEGDLAYKNMKRNKKKYRVTIISLFISIVLFISFSALVRYGLESSIDYVRLPEYEYLLYVSAAKDNASKVDELVNKTINIDGIKKYSVVQSIELYNNDISFEYSDDIKKLDPSSTITHTKVYSLDSKTYSAYLKELGLKTSRPIVINQFTYLSYANSSRKVKKAKIFDKLSDFSVSFYDYESDKPYDKKFSFNDIYLTDKIPMGLDDIDYGYINIIVSEDMYNEIVKDQDDYVSKTVFLLGNNYDEVDKIVKDVNADRRTLYVNTYNLKQDFQTIRNIILVVKILLYGFITLVTLIGITSVLNTINTSIALRRKEFAVLRSIGLTPKGFNKVLFFESLFFGLKSLIYGIPVSLIIIHFMHNSIDEAVELPGLLIPYESILLAVIGVFIIVMVSMRYASRKIKKENILDAIREENI